MLTCTHLVLLAALTGPAHLAHGSMLLTRHLSAHQQDAAETNAQEAAEDEPQFDVDPRLDDLLKAIETATDDIDVFRGTIVHIKRHAILGDETRRGAIIYKISTDPIADDQLPSKRFGIRFTDRIVGRRMTKQNELYVFDGRWLAEINYEDKQYISREIVAPGQILDPLALGQGPFPLPVGQPREEVLSRFEVSAASIPIEGPLATVAAAGAVDGITLTPRAGTPESREFTSVTVFYDRASRLPVGIHATHEGGNEDFVLLRDPEVNPELTADDIAALTVKAPTEPGWMIDER